MTQENYDKIKKFVLALPRDMWYTIDSIPKLTPASRVIFVEGCKKMIEDQDYDNEKIYLTFSNDYNEIRIFEDSKPFVNYKQFKI